jgi:hypothetical protein
MRVLAALALCSIVVAAPTQGGLQPEFSERDGNKVHDIEARHLVIGKLPSCSNDDDPSYNTGTTNYQPDQGTKVPKNGKNDNCDSGGKTADHCWTETWLVETAIEFNDWQNTGAAIDCATTSECDSEHSLQNQTCVTNGNEISNEIERSLELSLGFALPLEGFSVQLGGTRSYTWGNTTTQQTQVCVTTENSNSCTWDDKGCHQVWRAQRVRRIYGYISRVCQGDTSSKVMMHYKRANGQVIRGMRDFSYLMPVNDVIGCSAKCTDESYPDPTPANDQTRTPFSQDLGWPEV